MRAVISAGLEAIVRHVADHCPHLRLLGLMVMPPLDRPARPFFAQARAECARLKSLLSPEQKLVHQMDQLSMGTSADFVEAIAEGANWIRIGTDIFGPREEHA